MNSNNQTSTVTRNGVSKNKRVSKRFGNEDNKPHQRRINRITRIKT